MDQGDSLVYVGSGVALAVTGTNAVMTGRQASFQIGGSPMSIASGLLARNGGRIELERGTLATNQADQLVFYSLQAQGKDAGGASSKIRLSDMAISAGYNNSGHGAFEARDGGSVHFTGGTITGGKPNDSFGLFSVSGADSEVRAVRTTISLAGNNGLGVADQGKLILQSMDLSNSDGYLNMLVTGAGSQISTTALKLRNGRYDINSGARADVVNGVVENEGQSAFHVVGSEDGASLVKVDKGRYSSKGGYLVELDHDASFVATDATFETQDAWAALFTGSNSAELTLKKSKVKTSGKDRSHGVDVYGGVAMLEEVQVDTLGNAAYGLRGHQSRETNGSLLYVRDSRVTVQGSAGAALHLEGDKVEASLESSDLTASHADAHGMVQIDRAKLTVVGGEVNVTGDRASAYVSRLNDGRRGGNSVSITSTILRASSAPVVLLQGGQNTLNLREARLLSSEDSTRPGELLRVTDTPLPNNATLAAGTISIEAADTELFGNVQVDSSTADVRLHLKGASKLQGALLSSPGRQVAEFHVLDGSTWEVSGNSGLSYLNLLGSVEFAAPATASDFKVLQVSGIFDVENGVLMFNTQLGDDQSPSDQMRVGSDTFGVGKVRVTNTQGLGALTTDGIRLLQVDGQSNASLSLDGRVVAGAYEYTLHQGSVSAPDDGDWYLRSSQPPPAKPSDPITPEDPAKPGEPITPSDPGGAADPATPPAPSQPLWRPEVAAYQANQFAAISLFSHSLHDRVGDPAFAERQRDKTGGHVWVRCQRQQRDTRAADAQLAVASDSSLLQVGAEVTRWEPGDQRAHLGLMAGAVQAHSHVGSTLTGYRAKSTLRGTGVGVYGTWYARTARPGGLYLDSWVQRSQFNNQVLGQGLPVVNYAARSWTASLEAGYAWNWRTTAHARWMLEPQMQVVYVQHSAAPVREANGSRIDASAGTGIDRRLGLRLYAQSLDAQWLRVQPYLALHRQHYAARRGVEFGHLAMPHGGPRRVDTVQAGADAELGGGWTARGFISLRHGKGQYREVSGQIGLGYRW